MKFEKLNVAKPTNRKITASMVSPSLPLDTLELLNPKKKKAKATEEEPETPRKQTAVEIQQNHEIFAAEGLRGVNIYLGAKVLPKYKDKYFSWVELVKVRQRFRGWTPLKVDYEKHTATPCTLDEADKTTGNVLCWMEMTMWNQLQLTEDQRRKMIADEVAKDDPARHVDSLNAQFRGKLDGMNFAPLKEVSEPQ